MSELSKILLKYWGYSSFRPAQEEIITSVLNQQDTLALLPTGGGKSICFQVPVLALEGIGLVITPLIALMKDQVEHLREKGIKAVFDAQEEERQRIAKDLHDGVGQQISAVKIHLQGLKDAIVKAAPEQEKEFDSIVEMVTDTGTEVRGISHQMMPRALTELGLVAAMEDMLEKSFKYHNIRYSFEHHGLENRLDAHVEVGLYRIAQELVNNILKHAGASKVDVQLMKTRSHCVLIVQDNGKGIGSEKSDGIGMMNINNRVRTLHGELSFESGDEEGTTATIRIAIS